MIRVCLFIVLFLLCFNSVSASTLTRYGSDFKIVNNEISFKVSDRLGTDRLTFDDENVVAESNVLPYGQQLKNRDVKFGFTGKELDDTDNYYFNARYYDFDSGKFLGVDPVLDNHAYAFVSNNPMNYVDPSGMDKAEVKKYEEYIEQRKSTEFGEPLVTGLQYWAYKLIPDSLLDKLSEGRLRQLNFILKYLVGKGGSLDVEYSKEEWDIIVSSVPKEGEPALTFISPVRISSGIWKSSNDPNFPSEEGWEITRSFSSNFGQDDFTNSVWDILGTTSLVRKKTGTDEEGNDLYFYGIYGEDFDFVGSAFEGGTEVIETSKGRYEDAYYREITKKFYNFIKEKLGGKEVLENLFIAKELSDGDKVGLYINPKAMETHGTSIVVSAHIDNYKEETKEEPKE